MFNLTAYLVRNKSDNYGVYDYSGRQIFEEKYSFAINIDEKYKKEENKSFRYGHLVIGGEKVEYGQVKGGIRGIYDRGDGRIIIPCKYENAKFVGENLFAAMEKGKWALFSNGAFISPFEYEDVTFTNEESLFAIKKDGKWALYSNGSFLSPFQYDNFPKFESGIARVEQNGEVKFIQNPIKGSNVLIAQKEINDKKEKKIAVSRYPAPNSDVDCNIPMSKKKRDNLFAYIIANENYPIAPVPYALNDGRIFANYCESALGIPKKI